MASLFADENFSLAVVERLRALGHNVMTVQEAGLQGQTDLDVLSQAVAVASQSSPSTGGISSGCPSRSPFTRALLSARMMTPMRWPVG
jgi:hypothetical protein